MSSDLQNWSIPAEFRPKSSDYVFDIGWAVSSTLGLRATVAADAFTASVLGTERVGHGVAIDGDGTVLTIGYLITEADKVWLTTGERDVIPACVLGIDQATGFGLVRALQPLPVPSLEIGNSQGISNAEQVIIAGGGRLDRSISSQILARQEFAGYWEYVLDDAIYTAPAHPLWSGAAMIGANGKLAGIASLQLHQRNSDDSQVPINMVVPIELLPPILEDLKAGRPSAEARPWLGVFADDSLDTVVVLGTTPGGPAHRAELRRDDVILAVGATSVSTLAEFYRALWGLGGPGVKATLTIDREGDVFDVSITTRDRRSYLKTPVLH